MKLRIAICDDDKIITDKLTEIIYSFQIEQDVDLYVEVFHDGVSLLKKYQKPNDFHILFMDIEMPMQNGIQTAATIRSTIDRNVITVFVSSYPKYMHDSFLAHPYHFLTKPFTREQIFELLKEILSDINESHTLYTIVDTNGHEETLNLRDIVFFESLNSKKELLCIHMLDRKIITKGIITSWENELSDYNFVICHRGYLVNLIHIHYFEKDRVILDNMEEVPVSRTLRKKLRDMYMNRVYISKL